MRALLQRAFDFIRIPPLWYVPLILLMPCLTVVSYGLMRLMRAPLPHPEIPLLLGLALWPALVAGAMAEELGWSGYAIDPLQGSAGEPSRPLLLSESSGPSGTSSRSFRRTGRRDGSPGGVWARSVPEW